MGLKEYAGVARAPFLLLPATLVAGGSAAASLTGDFDLVSAALALVGLTGMHVAVNALNEWSDFRTGIDLETKRTPFSGGSGTLPSGAIPPRSALIVALVGAAAGVAVGALFLLSTGWLLVPFLAVGALSVFAYTQVLARLYVGEFFAGLGLGALPVLGTALVQQGRITETAIAASVPAFFMTFNLLLLNEFPDEGADRKGGRRNLVLLLGRPLAARLYAFFALLTPLAIASAVGNEILPTTALLAALPTLALAPAIRWAVTRPGDPVPIPALGANVAWNLATNATLAAALFLAPS